MVIMITTSILLLSVPTLTFLAFNDRKGDKHPNLDLLWGSLILAVMSLIVCLWVDPTKNFIQCFAMGAGIGWVVWPWLISHLHVNVWKVVELRKGVKWYNHFSKEALPDKLPIWNKSP